MLKEMIKNLNDKELLQLLEDIHAHDLSEIFLDLDTEDQERIKNLLTDENYAELISYLDLEDGVELFSDLDLSKQIQIAEIMEPDDAVDIIQELEEEQRLEIIKNLDVDSDIIPLIKYDEDDTGSAMTNQVVIIYPDMDVKVATKKTIKEAPEVETISTIFVTDRNDKFLGVVPLRKLLKARTPLLVETLIEDSPYVYDYDPIEKSISAINNYGIYEMPVLNDEDKLLGIITLDDVLDIYQEEAQEDYEKLASLPETLDHGLFRTAIRRFPWLFILIVLTIPISLVTSYYEEIIATVALLIIFQPLILDSAGNVATQTLAVTLKMLSTEEEGILKNSFREMITGVINGFFIGLVAIVTTLLFAKINPNLATNANKIALVVGSSLWIAISISPLVAIIIPIFLKKIKVDPAIASGPFITTVCDTFALIIYFGLATLLLGGF